MKKGIAFLILLSSLHISAQIDSSRIQFLELPDSTEIGIPNGDSVSKEIGPGGGMISSTDGRIDLIFPAGALTKATFISIIPTTNFAPNGTGNAYQCEPSGIQFKKPVQLIFHYSDEEAETCPPDLMGFGQQDHKGKWSFLDYDSWDSTTKTLKGRIEHFTGLANENKYQIIPLNYEMLVGDTLAMHIAFLKNRYSDATQKLNQARAWFVNDVRNGGEEYGRTVEILPQESAMYAFYYAPKVLPGKIPVIVSLDLTTHLPNGSKVATFTSRIKLYDEYKVLITDTIEARVGEGTFVDDSATFIVRITPKEIKVTDVRNYPPHSFMRHPPPLGGKIDILITDDCVGPVHIGVTRSNREQVRYTAKMEFIKVDKPHNVLITFATQENLGFRYKLEMRGLKLPIEMMPIDSVPTMVDFVLNGETQRYDIDSGAGTSYTIYVKRNTKERGFHAPR